MYGLTMTQIVELINERIKEIDYYARISNKIGDFESYRIACAQCDELRNMKANLVYACVDVEIEVKEQ